MSKETRIVLADDYPLLLESFSLMLANEPSIEIVGQVANGEQLVACVETERPDVVITDIEMPVMNGLDATRLIKERFPATGVLALTMFNDHHLIVDMMEAGANGYLLKSVSKEELLAAITAAKNGLQYFSNDTSMRLFKQLAQSKLKQEEETESFTEKEKEIIRLICQQYASKEIAALTQLSKRTVDKYRDHIMQKTKSTNLAGVVIYAIRHGLFKT
jgi:DNA-binding NarL/FixJ family response regulator